MRPRHILAAGIPVMAIAAVVILWSLGLSTRAHSPGSPGGSAGAQSPNVASPAVGPASAAEAIAPRGKPEFSAMFRGTHLNQQVWDTCYPTVSQAGCTNFGNPQEAEWYVPSQVEVSGGHLRLIATRETTPGFDKNGNPKTYDCRSGMVTTYPGFSFKYGFLQVVANVPHSAGLWPALWLATTNGSWPPEIDMLESWGVNQLTGSFYHPARGTRARAAYSPSLTTGWHTYSLSWTRSELTFYVDDRVVLTTTKDLPHQQMYFLANVAEYQPAKAGNCTGQMLIKSVKVWK
jgi:beta-glucanase (GH16 family)